MKPASRILALVILVSLAFFATSFFIPGKVAFIDSYSIGLERAVIKGLEKISSISIFRPGRSKPYTANAISYAELTPYLDEIKPGTLFFSQHGTAVSSMFIEGPWKHCGIFIGNLEQLENYWSENQTLVDSLRNYFTADDEYLIFDSSYELGVAIHSIRDMADLSETSTLRTLLLIEYSKNKDHWNRAILSALEHTEKEYDYCYVLDDDRAIYCSEFLYKILPLKKGYFLPSQKILGREFLLPSDLVQPILDKGVASGDFTYLGSISKSGKIK